MLEIVFNESGYVSLMMAQNYGKGPYVKQGGVPAMIFYGIGDKKPEEILGKEKLAAIQEAWRKEEQRNWEAAVPLGGKKSDVFGFDLFLSTGGIADGDFDRGRKMFVPSFDDTENKRIERRLAKARADLETICQRIAEGQEARIWYGRIPDDMCGMLWFCNQVYQRNLPCDGMFYIKLPDEKLGGGDLREEECHKYLSLQRPLTKTQIEDYSNQWKGLQEENSILRASINGRVVSVNEDFYDDLILKELDSMDDEFSQGKMISSFLDHYPVGLGDAWIRKRLDKQIDEGKLEIVDADSDCSWIRTLRKIK